MDNFTDGNYSSNENSLRHRLRGQYQTALIAFGATVLVPALLLNFRLIYVFLRQRHDLLRTYPSILLFNNFVADVVASLFRYTTIVLPYTPLREAKTVRMLISYTGNVANVVSTMNLILMAVDRYRVTVKPFSSTKSRHSDEELSRAKLAKPLVLLWTISALFIASVTCPFKANYACFCTVKLTGSTTRIPITVISLLIYTLYIAITGTLYWFISRQLVASTQQLDRRYVYAAKARKRSACIVLVLVVLEALISLPAELSHIIYLVLFGNTNISESFALLQQIAILLLFLRGLSDPIALCAMSKKIRYYALYGKYAEQAEQSAGESHTTMEIIPLKTLT